MIGIIGEALIDFIAKGTQGPMVPFDSIVGGCALNSAISASRQGSAVGYIGKISKDMFGQRILDYLVDNQVLFDANLCAVKEPTLLAFASLDPEGKATYDFYTEKTASVSIDTSELLQVMQEHTDLRVVHIGSISLALDPVAEAILKALEVYEPRPVVFFDPNVRPAVIEDEKVYKQRFERALQRASLVKLSDEDLALMYPGCDIQSKAGSLAVEQGKHCILTLGRKGSIWYTPEGKTVAMPIIDLPVVDTVGAGDTFSGALLSYLHDRNCFGEDGQNPKLSDLDEHLIRNALLYATAASAINCSRRGCNPPRKQEVLTLLSSL